MNPEFFNLVDERSRRKADVQRARPLSLQAEQVEVMSNIALWNMIAPGRKYRIDPRRPDLMGTKAMTRINALMHATRNARAQAAQYAAGRCLNIIKSATTTTEAAQKIAALMEGTEPEASTKVQEEDRAENQ